MSVCTISSEEACAAARGWPRQPRLLSGEGTPNGVEVGYWPNDQYLDTTTGILYVFNGTPGTKVGWFAIQGTTSVVTFGADPTGVSDSAAAIQDAIDSAEDDGGGIVFFPPGIYKCLSRIELASGVYILGSGTGSTTIDFTDAAGLITDACIYGTGTIENLSPFTVNISNSKVITFGSAQTGIVAGDILAIYNSADSSFSTARPSYRQGEFCLVEALNGNDINLTKETYDSYTAGATTTIYRVIPIVTGVSGVRVLSASDAPGIYFEFAHKSYIRNVSVSGSQSINLGFCRSFECMIDSNHAFDMSATIGENYGWKFANCQSCQALNNDTTTLRHGGNVGGVDKVCAVPNREIVVASNKIGCGTVAGTVGGFKIHGCSEHITVANNSIPCGLEIGGDFINLCGNEIGNAVNAGGCLLFGEMLGLNVDISSNTFYALKTWANALIAPLANSVTTRKSMFKFHGNVVKCGTFGALSILEFTLTGAPTDDIHIDISGNSLSRDTSAAADFYAIKIKPTTTLPIALLNIANNQCEGAGIYVDQNIRIARIVGNQVENAAQRGIYVHNLASSEVDQFWNVSNNSVNRSHHCGIDIRIPSQDVVLRCAGNDSTNNAQTATGSASTDASLYIEGTSANGQVVIVSGNTFGDVQGVATQQRAYSIANVSKVFDPDNVIIGSIPTIVVSGVTAEYGATRFRGNNTESYGTAAPVAETWARGDIVWNTTPLAAGVGWICVAAGTPGTWYEFGVISNPNQFYWDSSIAAFTVGNGSGTSGSASDGLYLWKNLNSIVSVVSRNTIGAGNTSAGAQFLAMARGCSGFSGAFSDDYVIPIFRDNYAVGPRSDAAHLVLAAMEVGQKVKGYAESSTVQTFEFDGSATAGHTRFLIYDVDSGLLQRVKVGANGTGPGGTGRALYIDNV